MLRRDSTTRRPQRQDDDYDYGYRHPQSSTRDEYEPVKKLARGSKYQRIEYYNSPRHAHNESSSATHAHEHEHVERNRPIRNVHVTTWRGSPGGTGGGSPASSNYHSRGYNESQDQSTRRHAASGAHGSLRRHVDALNSGDGALKRCGDA
ncbi:hypothetical protein HDU76_011630, partial [Blyttiomyces sp. JEL0837]